LAIPLLHRAFLVVGFEPAATTVFGIGQYVLVGIALFLVPTGMVGFHALQKRNYGLMGNAGLWMGIVASVVMALGLAGYLRWGAATLLWLVYPMGAFGLAAGFILYGIATLRAGMLPPWCGIAFAVVLPVAMALVWVRPLLGLGEGSSTTSILFGLVWLGLGYDLWTRGKGVW
jgi:hypothetical protein